ncbi:MAG: hypothetical protein Q4B84_04225 [Clostridia bacterium]|nr:hypothetical protein [Clostridia bacterium]
MFIKYDEIELLDFFEIEPCFIGDKAACEWMYTYSNNDFEIVFFISAYEMYVDVSISYKENTVCSEKYTSVSEIRQVDSNTLNVIADRYNITILKKPQIGIFVDNK